MVAVDKFAIVDHHAAGAFAGNIVIPPLHHGGSIDIGEEFADDILDGINPAKCSHNSFLGQRVFLLLSFIHPQFSLTA